MMKKSHGPAFRKQQIELIQCPACRGKAVIKGLFHEMACIQCNASGWVDAMGQALPLEELVTQLSLRLQQATTQIQYLRGLQESGAAAQYQHGNRFGAGGTNYTGD